MLRNQESVFHINKYFEIVKSPGWHNIKKFLFRERILLTFGLSDIAIFGLSYFIVYMLFM